ncbi:MAG: cytochrome c oxidase subunit II [Flavobacteriaceae bacterium]|nr:cytochrome c oxidase subunit II [Flavobacteriaceae bacterium]
MTALLVFIVLLLVGISVWQLTKIFELTQVGAEGDPEVANDTDNERHGYLMFGFLAFLYIFMIYGIVKWWGLLLPESASKHGEDYDLLMGITMGIIFIVQFLTQALLFYFAYKYRGRKGQKALHYADNHKLEIFWTIIPVVTLAGLILYGLFTWTEIMFVPEEEKENAIVVEIYAQQFNWTARYAGTDNVLGSANVRMIDNDRANVLGLDEADLNGADDIVTKEIHLPVGKRVIFKMRSQDVLHSAYMPHFRAQMNCVPGMISEFSFIPKYTTKKMREFKDVKEKVKRTNELRAKWKAEGNENADPWEFDYVLLCNKICGKSHYNMQMKIVVEEEEEYNQWLASQKTFKETIAAVAE